MRTTVVINPAVPMKKRLDIIDMLDLFLAGQDHAPTESEVRAFLDSIGEDKLKEFFVVMILDATAGLKPPQMGKAS